MDSPPVESTPSSLSLKTTVNIQLTSIDDDSPQETVITVASAPCRLPRVATIAYLCGVNIASSASNGLVVIAIPRLTEDLDLLPSLAFWPSSVQGLATASTLLLSGAIADVLGPRSVNLFGCILNSTFMLTCGLVKNGEQLVILRAMQGIATALHLSSSVALVTRVQLEGRARNLSFSFLGLSQLLGFSSSLVVGGILIDTIGWRSGWYFCGGTTFILFAIGWWSLPRAERLGSPRNTVQTLKARIDWIGALLSTASITLLTYFLAVISTDMHKIRSPAGVVPLSLSIVAAASFVYWMHSRVKRGHTALVPNELWNNPSFTGICITVALSFAVLNSLDLVTSLFFQNIQDLSALEAAIRMIPSMVVGLGLNIMAGLIVQKFKANWLVALSSLISAGSPLLMAVNQPGWTYWRCAFPAQVLMPFSIDILFTIGLIIITEIFPKEKHAVAGAVFNTAAQVGNALGLAVMQVISTWVTKQHDVEAPRKQALLEGYRATFWTMLALLLVCTTIGAMGLRRAGIVGLKHSEEGEDDDCCTHGLEDVMDQRTQ